MSTRATITLTSDNEHWHEELCAKWNYGIESSGDRCFVFEFSHDHVIENDTDGLQIAVSEDSDLGKSFKKLLRGERQ